MEQYKFSPAQSRQNHPWIEELARASPRIEPLQFATAIIPPHTEYTQSDIHHIRGQGQLQTGLALEYAL